jgi:hypothetical protein
MRNHLQDAIDFGALNRSDLRRLVNIRNQNTGLTPEIRAEAAKRLENLLKEPDLPGIKVDREILQEYYESLKPQV